MQPGPPRRRRARPVADAPIEALLLCSEDLTKGWLLELLEQSPLIAAPSIPVADLAHEGPRVCDAVVRALAADDDLRELEPGGALEPLVSRTGELAGAAGAASGSRAVDALGGVIWSALRAEIAAPDPDLICELAERLWLVIELVRCAVLRNAEGVAGEAPVAPWERVCEAEIARAQRVGGALSLLLVGLEEADRVLAVEPASASTAPFGRFAQAVRSAVHPPDILTRETDSRVWIIAPGTDRAGAETLATRIASAVRGAEPWRGAPMTVSIGIAVLGQDGRSSASLTIAAEEAMFAAAARGASIAHPAPHDGGGDSPADRGPQPVS